MKPGDGHVADVLEFLQSVALFSNVSPSSARTLASACRFRHLESGEILFFQSDMAEAAYVVRSGRVSIKLDGPDGRELVIDEMRVGDIFGETSLLTKKTHTAGATARFKSHVLVIPREAFLRVVDAEPKLARHLLEITAHRLQRSAAREMALAFMDAEARLARYLLALEEQEQDKGYVTASQEDLARGTGLIRQTVAKALGRWRRQGWLLTGRGRILVLNRKALEAVEHALPV
jgi:CRP/FNR family transcriptional regulator, cyclic AMP receptor protein